MEKWVLRLVLLSLFFAKITPQIINSTGLLSGCGKTKACFSEPSGCSADCTIVGTWSSEGNSINFELVGKADGWVAIGFNEKRKMAGAEALICLRSLQLFHYTLPGLDATKTGKTNGFTLLSSSFTNGYVRCSFRREKNPGNGMKDLNEKWHILFAVGKMATSTDIKRHDQKFVTLSPVDLSVIQNIKPERTISPLLKLHGCVMLFAWLALAIVGMFFARYMKNAFGDQMILGLKAWFQVHRALMLFTALFTIVGGILIFQEQDWEMEGSLHPVIGLIVIILACLQPLLALLRPGPKDNKRWIFNWGHRTIGAVTLILAVVAIFLGINLDEMSLGAKENVVIAVYLVLVLILVTGLELYERLLEGNNEGEVTLSDVTKGEVNVDHSQIRDIVKGRKLRKLVLTVLSVLSTIAVLISVIFIATAKPQEGQDYESDSDEE